MQALKSKSLLFDLLGAFVRDLGGWIAVADVVVLMGDLGVDEQAVRSSVSRFTRRGLLERQLRTGQIGYALSPAAEAILAEGDRRIFRQLAPADLSDGWALVSFSVPEVARSDRHQLRSRLRWLGYGNLGLGLWIAPRRMLDMTVAAIEDLALMDHVDVFEASHRAFGSLEALAQRCWRLDDLQQTYREFISEYGALDKAWLGRVPAEEPNAAFRDYVAVLHTWRKLPYLDPGLPSELLPPEWAGKAAADLFASVRGLLEPAARAHVASVIGRR